MSPSAQSNTNPPGSADPILKIEDLTISYRTEGIWNKAVQDFSLEVRAGETYGLVGESGSGKTTVVLAIMRYLSSNGRVDRGRIILNGTDLLSLSRAEMRAIWGRSLTLVPQDPLSALNPSIKIGEQMAEPLRRHMQMDRKNARERTLELLDMVHIAEPERVIGSYPHQISGGMQQRVMIAMALSTEPDLLVLDEPTTSLDVTTQAVVLDLVRELIRGRRTAALYITHNLGVVAQICDRVAVLYASELVEDSSTRALYRKPLHPYTRGLLDSVPRLGENKAQVRLRAIQGQIPYLDERPSGCVFVDRCPLAIEICHEHPPLYDAGKRRRTRCHRWEGIASGELDAHQPAPEQPAPEQAQAGEEVLAVRDLRVYFPVQRSILDVLQRKEQRAVRAVDGVDLSVHRGRTLGLVGESGSGKTTFSRAVMGLVEKSSGEVTLLEMNLPADISDRTRETLSQLQMVLQNPEEALNPYLSIGEMLRRPLVTLMGVPIEEADDRARELLQAVRLPEGYLARRPAQLSGGEKQRVAVARAFASNPELLIADEPVSSLDVSVQASILNLISALQAEHNSSLVFISHDLAVVGFLSDVIAVIYLGKLMEVAQTEDLFMPPYHPYTEALLSAIPLADPQSEQKQIRLEGELPKPTEDIRGCPFHTRCPRFLGDICIEEQPPWRETENGNRIYCHIPLDELREVQTRVFSMGVGELYDNEDPAESVSE